MPKAPEAGYAAGRREKQKKQREGVRQAEAERLRGRLTGILDISEVLCLLPCTILTRLAESSLHASSAGSI